MSAPSMSDIHGLVTSGAWWFPRFRAAMSHLSLEDAVAQYVAILESAL